MITFDYICNSAFKPSVAHKIWLQQVIRKEGKIPGDLSYIFCDDAYMLEQNNAFLNHDTYTDIITFDYSLDDTISGDIFISLDTVRSNAKQIGTSYEQELNRVIIHGILHLCGINDKGPGEREMMEAAEDKALKMR